MFGPGVVEDPVADRRGEVEAGAVALQHLDHPQRVLVVLEARVAAIAQAAVQGFLARVPEGWVAEVVAEPDRLGQVLVQAERAGDGASDPAGLERVGEAGPVVIPFGGDEDLGLVLQAAEGLRVDDPVAIALKRRAQRAVGLGAGAVGGIGPRRVLAEELVLPGPDAALECDGGGHPVDHRSTAPEADFVVVPVLMPRRVTGHGRGAPGSLHRPLDLAQSMGFGRRSFDQRLRQRFDHEAVGFFGEGEGSGLAAGADDAARGAREARQVLRLAAVGAGGELRREAGDQGQLEAEGERDFEADRPRLARLVEQREITAEQVVGGQVGLGRVEQAQDGVAGAGAAADRGAVGAQPRVAVDGGDAGHRHQVTAPFVEDEVDAEERLQPPAEAGFRLAGALCDRPEAAQRRRVEVQDPIGLPVSDAPQDNCLRLDRGSRHQDKCAGRIGRNRRSTIDPRSGWSVMAMWGS